MWNTTIHLPRLTLREMRYIRRMIALVCLFLILIGQLEALDALYNDSTYARPDYRAIAAQIRSLKYTHILDLQGGLRTAPLRVLAGGPWSGVSHRRLARTLLIRFKHNAYSEHVPVPERYFEAAADWA
jgi:ADP-heptose:LPS heptosyltransferase